MRTAVGSVHEERQSDLRGGSRNPLSHAELAE